MTLTINELLSLLENDKNAEYKISEKFEENVDITLNESLASCDSYITVITVNNSGTRTTVVAREKTADNRYSTAPRNIKIKTPKKKPRRTHEKSVIDHFQ